MTEVDFYDKEQTDALVEGKADADDVYTKEQIDNLDIGATTDEASATGSLWARIKHVLAHWLTSDTEQTVTAKKTFSVSPEVPTTPATPTSAVNDVYVNDATDGVNNIMHKSGNETVSGIKTFETANDPIKFKFPAMPTRDAAVPVTMFRGISWAAADDSVLAYMELGLNSANNNRVVVLHIWNPTTQAYEDLELKRVTP